MRRSMLITNAIGGLAAPPPPKLIDSLTAVYLWHLCRPRHISSSQYPKHHVIRTSLLLQASFYCLGFITVFAPLPQRQSEFELRKYHQ